MTPKMSSRALVALVALVAVFTLYRIPGVAGPATPPPSELCGQAGWVGTLDPSLKHQDLRSSRVEGLGDWLLRREEFLNWNTGEDGVASPVLFCYGDPGVGKTHIGYELAFPWENGGV